MLDYRTTDVLLALCLILPFPVFLSGVVRHTDGCLSVQARRNQNVSQMTGCRVPHPSPPFWGGGEAKKKGEGSVWGAGVSPPPSKTKSAKDEAPDQLWQSKR